MGGWLRVMPWDVLLVSAPGADADDLDEIREELKKAMGQDAPRHLIVTRHKIDIHVLALGGPDDGDDGDEAEVEPPAYDDGHVVSGTLSNVAYAAKAEA